MIMFCELSLHDLSKKPLIGMGFIFQAVQPWSRQIYHKLLRIAFGPNR